MSPNVASGAARLELDRRQPETWSTSAATAEQEQCRWVGRCDRRRRTINAETHVGYEWTGSWRWASAAWASASAGPVASLKMGSPSSARCSTVASFFDTAEGHGPLANEELVGKRSARFAIRSHCDQVQFKFEGGKQAGLDSRPAHIREVADASLKRLATDRIDLIKHRVDRTSIGCCRRGEGPFASSRHFGLRSGRADDPSRARRAAGRGPAERASLWWRERTGKAAGARGTGIGFVPFSPLGKDSSPEDRYTTTFDSTDFEMSSRASRRRIEGESGVCRLADEVRGADEENAGADRARGCWRSACDRADSGDDQASSTRGEPRRRRDSARRRRHCADDRAASQIAVHGARHLEHLQKLVGR